MSTILFSVLCSLAAIVVAIVLIVKVMKEPGGDKKMQDIAHAIQIGAKAYLNRQYKTVAIVAVVAAALIGWGLGLTTMARISCRSNRFCTCGIYRHEHIGPRKYKDCRSGEIRASRNRSQSHSRAARSRAFWWLASRFSRSPYFTPSRIM